MKTFSSRIRGFSLIELLVVMLIIGIIARFAVPAASTILKGSQLTQASQIVTDQFNLARQTALARNHAVEVRLIQFADPEMPGETAASPTSGQFRAIWVFEDSGASTVINNVTVPIMAPVDKPQTLPQSIIMSPSSTFSTLITNQPAYVPPIQPIATDPQLYPRSGTSTIGGTATTTTGVPYVYVAFRFNPDGSTNLLPQTSQWFVTLLNINDQPTGNVPPKNFFTLLVDPVIGTVKLYRPGV